ncbi:MAG: PepSY domain-containing protein [Lentisphaeria bacterium]|nr:PepSY domain-containing protein [Lentisphaeria bacterium]
MNHILIVFFLSTLSVFAQFPEDHINWRAAASDLTNEEREIFIQKIAEHIKFFSKKQIQNMKGNAYLGISPGSSSEKQKELTFHLENNDYEFFFNYTYKSKKLHGYVDFATKKKAEKLHESSRIEESKYQHKPQEALEKAAKLIKELEGVDITDTEKWKVDVDRDYRQLAVTILPVFHGHYLLVGLYRVTFSDIENLKVSSYANSFDIPIPEYKQVPDVISEEKAIKKGKKFLEKKGFSVEDKPIRYELLVKRPSGWFTEVPEKYSRDDNWRDKEPIWVWQVVFRRLPSKVFVNWNNIPVQVDVDAITGKVVGGAD